MTNDCTKQALLDLFSADEFARQTGVVIDDYLGEGVAVTHLEVEARHLNGNGYAQGGVLFTLADVSMAVAANGERMGCVSIDVNMQYVRGTHTGLLECRTERMADHHRLPSYKATLTQDGKTVCVAMGVFYNTGIRD